MRGAGKARKSCGFVLWHFNCHTISHDVTTHRFRVSPILPHKRPYGLNVMWFLPWKRSHSLRCASTTGFLNPLDSKLMFLQSDLQRDQTGLWMHIRRVWMVKKQLGHAKSIGDIVLSQKAFLLRCNRRKIDEGSRKGEKVMRVCVVTFQLSHNVTRWHNASISCEPYLSFLYLLFIVGECLKGCLL